MKYPIRIVTILGIGLVLLITTAPGIGQPPGAQNVVKLQVLVPQADAKLWIFATPNDIRGIERTLVSPPLAPGNYHYDVKIMWEPNNYTKITRQKRIFVQPGKTYIVDLRKKNPKIPDHIKVRYVPTPQVVVDEMLKLGKVGKGDVVFDLGCGDGRFVISAVSKFGAKSGIGVDIDPKRIDESRANAARVGVTGKVKFRLGDVLKKVDDLEKANVVMLYMGNDINLRLRPLLRTRLKPGSRVVSHRFHMGDWQPDQKITVKDKKGNSYNLLLWNITEKTKELEKR